MLHKVVSLQKKIMELKLQEVEAIMRELGEIPTKYAFNLFAFFTKKIKELEQEKNNIKSEIKQPD